MRGAEGLEGDVELGYEAFALRENAEAEARRYFEAGRKKRFLVFGSGEKIDSIEKRYAPLGRFNVFRRAKDKKGVILKRQTLVDKENTVYVDLAHLELFYVKKKILGKASGVEHSDILLTLQDLPEEASDLLMDLIEFGSVSYEQVSNPVDEKNMILLMQRGLIESYSSKSDSALQIAEAAAKGYGYEESRCYVRSTIRAPKLDDDVYDLESFLKMDDCPDPLCEKDPIEFTQEEVSGLLWKLFLGEAVFKGIVCLPYFICHYSGGGSKSRQRRYELYFPIQFI